jgi:hypothetical protein
MRQLPEPTMDLRVGDVIEIIPLLPDRVVVVPLCSCNHSQGIFGAPKIVTYAEPIDPSFWMAMDPFSDHAHGYTKAFAAYRILARRSDGPL